MAVAVDIMPLVTAESVQNKMMSSSTAICFLKIVKYLFAIIFCVLFLPDYKSVLKVSPCDISPVLNPFLNQNILCAEVPCVKASGTT